MDTEKGIRREDKREAFLTSIGDGWEPDCIMFWRCRNGRMDVLISIEDF